MRARCAFALLYLSVALSARAQDGGAAGAFVRLSWGARALALGDALVAVPWGVVSGVHNPALLPWSPGQIAGAFAALLPLDRQLMGVFFQAPLRPSAGMMASLVQAGVEGIDGRDGSGYHTEWLGVREQRLYFGFGYRAGPRAAFGVGFSFSRNQLHASIPAPSTLGVDAGLLLEAAPNWYLGVSVADLLARYSWDTANLYGSEGNTLTDRFPLRLRLGSAWRPGGNWMIATALEARLYRAQRQWVEFVVQEGTPVLISRQQGEWVRTLRWSGGIEYTWPEGLIARAGLQAEPGGWRPAAGFGLHRSLGALWIETAYAAGWDVPIGLLSHRIEVAVRF
jgi:hypothetical protein|nr:MAG: hypothetical protein KatS3mg041_0714 [Bacteroidota bacterium]